MSARADQSSALHCVSSAWRFFSPASARLQTSHFLRAPKRNVSAAILHSRTRARSAHLRCRDAARGSIVCAFKWLALASMPRDRGSESACVSALVSVSAAYSRRRLNTFLCPAGGCSSRLVARSTTCKRRSRSVRIDRDGERASLQRSIAARSPLVVRMRAL